MLAHWVYGITNHLYTQSENLVILNVAVDTQVMVNYTTCLLPQYQPNLSTHFPILNQTSNRKK